MTLDPRLHELLKKIDSVAPDDVDATIVFSGVNFQVKAGVFNPAKGKSARRMAKAIEICPPSSDSRILEIGTGCGVLSSLLWLRGCRYITATDIMNKACDCAKNNFDEKSFDIPVIQSDLFESVEEKFDYIIFNAPATHPSRINASHGSVTLWDPSGNLKSRFVEGVRRQKKNNRTKALFMYSSYLDYDSLENIDFSGFNISRLLIEKNDISESGVIMLTSD